MRWPVAVQHGPKNSVIANALKNKDANKMSDAQLIDAIYDERSSQVKNTKGEEVLKYFPKSSKNVQDSIKERFNQERTCAKHILDSENKTQE